MTSFNVSDWRRQLTALQGLPNRGHIEVWLEWLPDTASQLRVLNSLLMHERIIVHAPFIGISIASPWRELSAISRDRLINACDVANELNAKVVTMHVGHVPFFEAREAIIDRIARAYEDIQRRSAATVIAIENMYRGRGVAVCTGASIADMIDLFTRIPSISFTLDVGHAIQNNEGYCEFLQAYKRSIVNIHLHDGIIEGAAHLRLGKGQLDLESFLHCCIESEYDQYISLETISDRDTIESWAILQDALRRAAL